MRGRSVVDRIEGRCLLDFSTAVGCISQTMLLLRPHLHRTNQPMELLGTFPNSRGVPSRSIQARSNPLGHQGLLSFLSQVLWRGSAWIRFQPLAADVFGEIMAWRWRINSVERARVQRCRSKSSLRIAWKDPKAPVLDDLSRENHGKIMENKSSEPQAKPRRRIIVASI